MCMSIYELSNDENKIQFRVIVNAVITETGRIRCPIKKAFITLLPQQQIAFKGPDTLTLCSDTNTIQSLAAAIQSRDLFMSRVRVLLID